ncbi:MAG: hypothetical protein N2558_04740 [Patescibacteria group bacterium]|nr:hypothetical protein [Patescibacteria group bacterium]
MSPKFFLRLSVGCLLFFALGHSIGHFTRHNVSDPKAKEILRQMSENKFDMFGQMRSYDENYTGMSFNLILTLLTFAVVISLLTSQTEKYPRFIRNILIPISVCLLGFSVTSFIYFFYIPAVTSMLAYIFVTLSILSLSKHK